MAKKTIKFLAVFLFSFCFGCASLRVEAPNGWKVSYFRFWDQELSNVYFDFNSNGTISSGLGSQKTDMEKTLQFLLQSLRGVN